MNEARLNMAMFIFCPSSFSMDVTAMEQVELGWDDFWAEIFRVKHRGSIPGIQHYDEMVVEFCIQTLNLKKGDEILDIACGAGDHSILFSKRGLRVTAFDLSETLIEFAKENAEREKVDVQFYRGDMREMDFNQKFKGAVLLSHSFGFFNHEENKGVLEGSYNSLGSKGRFLLDLMNPYNLPKFQRNWTTMEGGYLLTEPHVLDAPSGVLRGRPATFVDTEKDRLVLMNEDAMANNDIRMYTALEIGEILEEVGFSKVEFWGQTKLPRTPYSANCERMVVVATK
ncbi:class I SAM-dependent methyltransferase [Candidatus Thorarchaeota archaeon]|nr:MAG: class I SAM-dependent methyltransferase [Candidatus Thorarchaeota archaeon]